MSVQPKGQAEGGGRQTSAGATKRLEEVFELVDPCDWGAPRSEYARRRARTRTKVELSEVERLRLQDAYLGAQILLENSAADRLFVNRMQSMTALVCGFANEMTAPPRHLGDEDPVEVKERLLEHFCLELCMVSAAAVLYGPPEHRADVRAALQKLAALRHINVLEAYPALLLFYVTGVSSVLAEDLETLQELVLKPFTLEFASGAKVELEFDLYRVLGACAVAEAGLTWHKHVRDWLQPILTILTGASETKILHAIMQFELLFYLLRSQTNAPNISHIKDFCTIHAAELDEAALVVAQMSEQKEAWFFALFNHERHRKMVLNVLAKVFDEYANPKSPRAVARPKPKSEPSEASGEGCSNEEQG